MLNEFLSAWNYCTDLHAPFSYIQNNHVFNSVKWTCILDNIAHYCCLHKLNRKCILVTISDNYLTLNITVLTPRNMFLEVSKPAAYILQIFEQLRSANIRQANLDMVLCITLFSPVLSPGIVSITTKSIGDSEDLPIWKFKEIQYSSFFCFQAFAVSIYHVKMHFWTYVPSSIASCRRYLTVPSLNAVLAALKMSAVMIGKTLHWAIEHGASVQKQHSNMILVFIHYNI